VCKAYFSNFIFRITSDNYSERLVLEPSDVLLRPRVPGVEMERMRGRQELDEPGLAAGEGDILQLQPSHALQVLQTSTS
jgi:hypothetical protein